MKKIDGSICAPQGFKVAGVHAGIRKNTTKLDLALIYSDIPAKAAGVFTTNKVKAAPVVLTQAHLRKGTLQAIVANSGNANACTGPAGEHHAYQMAQTAALALGVPVENVGVASTGIIGVPLPIHSILPKIVLSAKKLGPHDAAAASAIMTTDTSPKALAVEIIIDGQVVRLGGIAKGSGMIHPNMATMLAFLTTDAAIAADVLQQALSQANQSAFNMITVDGDSSTNDMVLLLANGKAGNPEITSLSSPSGQIFYAALCFVCTELAKLIAQDGEGATKLLEVHVTGAANQTQAQVAARAVCRSPLVKTAVYGEDANWGRVACAIGASGADVSLNDLSISLGELPLLQKGVPLPFAEDVAHALLGNKVVVMNVTLGRGPGEATAWGCDLTHKYIDINASYRS